MRYKEMRVIVGANRGHTIFHYVNDDIIASNGGGEDGGIGGGGGRKTFVQTSIDGHKL